MVQDHCIGAGFLDVPRWTETIFFPLTMVCGSGTITVDDPDGFAEHLEDLQRQAARRGMAGFRTRITSVVQPSEKMAVIAGYRDHVDAGGRVITSSSMTWSLVLAVAVWKINLIHFNDTRQDPSVVSELCRGAVGGT